MPDTTELTCRIDDFYKTIEPQRADDRWPTPDGLVAYASIGNEQLEQMKLVGKRRIANVGCSLST